MSQFLHCPCRNLRALGLKAGTHYRIIGPIFVPISPLMIKASKGPIIMFAKDIVSEFPVEWGVLRVILSGQICSEGVGRRDCK